MTLSAGDRFEHYLICDHVAQGGIGDVYKALDALTGREVALKIPKRSVILDPTRYEQFVRELEALPLLQHPTVQHVIASGRSSDNTPFLVTEWVAGKSLRSLLKGSGVFSVDQAIILTCRIAASLEYCHQQGVIHRDLKPENILITPAEQPVILDFGLALTPTRPSSKQAAGTPDYMAPEQIRGEIGDHRIDIYALGTMLYEMLAGELPFIGKDAEDALKKHLYDPVPHLDQISPQVSRQLAVVVARCLQHSPDQRYADMQALIEDLTHPEQIDPHSLDRLTRPPAKARFFETQAGQVLLVLTAVVIGITFITLLAVALKQATIPTFHP